MQPTLRNSGTAVWAPGMVTALDGPPASLDAAKLAALLTCLHCLKAQQGFAVPSAALYHQRSGWREPGNEPARANHALKLPRHYWGYHGWPSLIAGV